METTNAFDLLVLPTVLGVGGAFAACALLHFALIAVGRLVEVARRAPEPWVVPSVPAPRLGRPHRPHVRVAGPAR